MTHWRAAREKYQELNSLVMIPHILVNHNTIIDMRNETSVAGTIQSVDGFMNITMKNVVFIDQRNDQHSFDMFHIPARVIRYIHIPQSFNVKNEMKAYVAKLCKKKTKPKQIKSFKLKRAQRNQQETLNELAATQANKVETTEDK